MINGNLLVDIKHNRKSLRAINLDGNYLQKRELKLLSNAMKTNCNVTKLSLKQTNLDDKKLKLVLKNKHVHTLDLGYNLLTDKAAKLLANADNLYKIYIDKNFITERGLTYLKEKSKTIKKIIYA